MDRLDAFSKGMSTWAKWVDSNIDPAKTKVFFQGISPLHFDGHQWGQPDTKGCAGQTKPLSGSTYPGGPVPPEAVVKSVLAKMSKPALNSTVKSMADLISSTFSTGGNQPPVTSPAVPGASTTFTQFTLYFKDYDVSLTFTDNLFLVDLVNKTDGVALVLDSIQGGKEWLGMDVLIFNSWHWWIRAGQFQPWNYMQIGNQKFKDMDRLDAFSKGMSTWAKWVDTNIDPAKTKVFFQGISPIHYVGSQWGQPDAKSCSGQTKPLSGSTYPGGPLPPEGVVKSVLSKMSKPDYDVSVAFMQNMFLVDMVNKTDGMALVLGSIQGGKEWLGMDVLIFNSWYWWTHTGKGQPWNYIHIGNQKFKDMDRLDAFSKGMSTWAKWVDTNIDPAKTKVFFQGLPPTHYDGHLWDQPDAKSCTEQTKPLSGSTYPGGPVPSEGVVNSVLSEYNDYNETKVGINKASCNIYQGSWVLDNTYPLYQSSGCPYIDPQFDCQKYGRPDKLYLQYRWKPTSCDIPRFDGKDFLMRMKGKKILFVGDSLSRNNVQSLMCLLHAAVPDAKTTYSPYTLYFQDYDVTVALNRNWFLVDLVNKTDGVALVLDSIQGGKEWLGMDVLIFNSWHWWIRAGQFQPWNYIQIGNQKFKDMDRLDAYSKGMSTWAKWVDTNIDPAKTKVFFQGISPIHYDGHLWGQPDASCTGQTKPLSGSTYPGGPVPSQGVVKSVLGKMSKPVTLLDLTLLSQLRVDAHPSK
ncbi:hypothetical protein QJS10_CPB20g01983 [Acorus calamus]|uniref:Trichome birefringence-like N-terminal domain-containing protein n=1 Tax=Acorus calamus TaxID=4465 RepID=A0AAV9C934_ACOCL|nr:hypothetical protein QJS10_CPB20g01983 [Acorus calamus]